MENKNTEFNLFVKSLDIADRKEFKQKILTNSLIWAPNKNKQKRELSYNNWRYKGQGSPSYPAQIFIYIIAKEYDKNLKFQEIFPETDGSYVTAMTPFLVELYNKNKNHIYNEVN